MSQLMNDLGLIANSVAGVELVVTALLGDELIVGALFDDAAALHDHDDISVAHGAETVSYDKGGATMHQ